MVRQRVDPEPAAAAASAPTPPAAAAASPPGGAGAARGESEERYAPVWCNYRLLRPLLCLFIGCGQPPEMTRRQWAVVSAVSVGGFFSHFDDDLLPLCLRQLQQSLDISEAQVCLMLSVIATGKAGAAFTSVLADVLGRRYVFFASILVFSLLSVLTALQHSVAAFVVLQLVARIFLAGKDSMANVYLVEETDPKCRGWVMGTYSSVAVTGGGTACILFGLVGGMEDGWRYLYGLASLQLFFLVPLWNLLPAKTRGSMSSECGHGRDASSLKEDALRKLSWQRRVMNALRNGLRPLRLLATSYPRRAAACLFVNVNNGFAFTPSAVLKIKHLQDVHGLSPRTVSLVVISSGLVALVVFPLLGRLSDRGGRRTLLCCFMTVCPIGVLAFYNAPGNLYLPFYFVQMMASFALNVLSTTYFAESFPASHRCTANGVMMLFAVIGGTLGLAAESFVYTHLETHAASVSVVLLPAFLSPIVVRLALPETAGRDLDEIAPEKAGGAVPASSPAKAKVEDDDGRSDGAFSGGGGGGGADGAGAIELQPLVVSSSASTSGGFGGDGASPTSRKVNASSMFAV